MAAPHVLSDLDHAKAAARTRAHAARIGCDPSACGAQLAAHVLAGLHVPRGAAVSGFWPMGEEIDIRPLLEALHARGHPVLLPETPPRGRPLIFRLWHPGAAMIRERFGTSRPDGPEGVPDIMLVPLLAFDRSGHRLGYGGGYYDRTIAGLPHARTIGCAYAAQEVDAVPVGVHDKVLDAIVTECGVIQIKGF